MGYVGYAGQGQGGQSGLTRSQVDPGVSGYGSGLANIGQLYGQTYIDPANQQGQNALVQGGNADILQQMQGAWNADYMQQQSGFQMQNLGLDTQGLGIQRGALQRQAQLLPQQYGLQTQGFDLSQQELQTNAANQLYDLNAQATASGNYTGGTANRNRGNIQRQLQYGLQNLGLQRQGAQLNFKEQQAQNADAEKQLDLQSQRLGISKDEIRSRLDHALQSLGISSNITSNQVLQGIGSIAQGEFSPYSGFYADIISAANLPIAQGQ